MTNLIRDPRSMIRDPISEWSIRLLYSLPLVLFWRISNCLKQDTSNLCSWERAGTNIYGWEWIYPESCLGLPALGQVDFCLDQQVEIEIPWFIHLCCRGEREFPLSTIPGNTSLPILFPKIGNDFFIPVPKSWEWHF